MLHAKTPADGAANHNWPPILLHGLMFCFWFHFKIWFHVCTDNRTFFRDRNVSPDKIWFQLTWSTWPIRHSAAVRQQVSKNTGKLNFTCAQGQYCGYFLEWITYFNSRGVSMCKSIYKFLLMSCTVVFVFLFPGGKKSKHFVKRPEHNDWLC